jgi:hypothetical protein
MFFIIISAVHVAGGFSAHHQGLIKLYVQPWVLSCFPAFYRWCGWVVPNLREETITFVMSVRLSVLMEQLGSHWTDFYEI